MKKYLRWFGEVLAGMSMLAIAASPVLAQTDYSYDYSSDISPLASLLSVGLCGLPFLFPCCMAVIGIGFLVFRIFMVVHVIQHAPEDEKTTWMVLVLLVPLCDWVYFFTKRSEWSKQK